jgi:Mn2+/Fe2+ NRAMP family transporter
MDYTTLNEIESSNQAFFNAFNQSVAQAEHASTAAFLGFGLFLLLFSLVFVVIFAIAGAYVAAQKHRPRLEGAVLGGMFGLIGLLIEVLLPQGNIRQATQSKKRPWFDTPSDPAKDAELAEWLKR